MRRTAIVIALLAAAVLPQSAAGHSLVRPAGAVVSYLSADATSLNTLTVRESGSRIEFRDPTVDGGMDPGSCTPGDVAGGFIIQTFCPAAGVSRVRVDLGEREDSAVVTLPIAVTLLGGPGADDLTAGAAGDELTGGEGNDALAGREGDDTFDGGLGKDTLDGGSGADLLLTRDGLADVVRCGAGDDTVDADTVDNVDADCEGVTRTFTAPPSGSNTDKPGRPALDVGAPIVQRLGRARRVRVYATSNEPGAISASGFLDIAGLSLPVSTDRRHIQLGGAGVAITYRLEGSRWRQTRRALRRGRLVTVRLGVVATDLPGNSRLRRAPSIRLALRGGAASKASAARDAGGGAVFAARHPEPGDIDGDEVRDEFDNCPTVKNGSQIDTDDDGAGDACDGDDDGDGVLDEADNCRIDPNPDQADSDGDGYGDACPPVDSDADGVINDDDNCDLIANPDQQDLDGDDKGDACDRDVDGDRFDNEFDNCPTVYNLEPTDIDGDGLINDQLDRDGDGIGTACDPDESVIEPPPNDGTPPRVALRAASTQSLAQLRAGMIVRIRCSEGCAARTKLVVSRPMARRLRLGKRIVARGASRLDARGITYAFVRAKPAARRALAGSDGVRAKLLTTVSDPSGNSRRVVRSVVLRP